MIKVRFAPSPTGFVHVGSLRTALYNFLFARQHNGQFVLRIEDTDRNRLVEGAVDNLLNTLKWCGIDYDQGPDKEDAGISYYQSKRTEIYKKYAEELMEKGHAFRCFCSGERLKKVRKKQEEKQLPIRYDGLCRNLSAEESQKRAETEKFVIRLKVASGGETVVEDIIRGKINFLNNVIDDQVLIKSDGYPTYHLANVVDDHLMGITHVIRGEEWLPSTPKHVLLYEYLDWQKPVFAHLPLLLNPDRSKLSKRQGDVAVEDYRDQGYLPEALINFVALLGWNKGDNQEIFSIDELIKYFSIDKVGKTGAVFNIDKLNWMNGHYIRNIPEEKYIKEAIKFLPEEAESTDQSVLKKIVLAEREKINTLAELREKTKLFFSDSISEYTAAASELINKESSKNIFNVMLNETGKYEQIDINSFKEIMMNVQKRTQIKGKDLWLPVRATMTGTTEGPELPLVIEIFGKEKIMKLLRQALEIQE